MEHEHPAPAPTQAPSRIIVIDDEQVLRHGLGNDIDVADIPGVIRSVMRRTAVPAIKHSSVLDSSALASRRRACRVPRWWENQRRNLAIISPKISSLCIET